MKGQTVSDVNRFVLLTVERVKGMREKLAEQKFSGRPALEGVAPQRVIDALEVAALHLEGQTERFVQAVAAWHFA